MYSRILQWLIRTSFFLFNLHETKTGARPFKTSARLFELGLACFKQAAASFHLTNLSLFK